MRIILDSFEIIFHVGTFSDFFSDIEYNKESKGRSNCHILYTFIFISNRTAGEKWMKPDDFGSVHSGEKVLDSQHQTSIL